MQTPILASLLALIHQQEPAFSSEVVSKVSARLLQALREDDVPTAKLLLRAVACLANCNSFAVGGEGGLAEVLRTLLAVLQSGERDVIVVLLMLM